ncbi:ABC transporter substrate-binding protein [Paenibacillus alginolyticus]|uniref:Extracellular solute-binding protein n=1 Tax=Paenibacillus alginolyticus TaxID=59839 RepID=A0ABT4GGH7_9BACL|nr:extracellular solute-binding protein [Paenibacillus alginolyticus]MCY9695296.1 extracellular solute-binding protein [Paenibacillus alginolyticus]MEC0144812.1 extracellular solute-binding protein [Paenibacillus alginolyticus]
MIELKGMTWNHVRGYGPLEATSEQFQLLHPEVQIRWDRRSLKDFGDYPVDKLAAEYDIIMIDHPHVGISSTQGVLVPLDEWIASNFLYDQKMQSVGPSAQSYYWEGHQWALAVDAAAQVSAYRPDLMDGRPVPSKWNQVLELASTLPNGRKVGFPLCPTDAMCSLISICANIAGGEFIDETNGIDPEAGEAAVALLQQLLPFLHPKSLDFNPIQMLDQMSASDEIAYIPLLFGYSNYSRSGFARKLVHFTNIPSHDGRPHGSILGGVGMAVSALSPHIPLAVEYAKFTASGVIQQTAYVDNSGQPGHRQAWIDADVNRKTNDFFDNTLETLDRAYMRPRHASFPLFQERAGVLLHEDLLQGSSPRDTIARMNEWFKACKADR